MTTNPLKGQITRPKSAVIQWLLDSDPAIRWKVMRDLTGEPDEVVAANRAQLGEAAFTEAWAQAEAMPYGEIIEKIKCRRT